MTIPSDKKTPIAPKEVYYLGKTLCGLLGSAAKKPIEGKDFLICDYHSQCGLDKDKLVCQTNKIHTGPYDDPEKDEICSTTMLKNGSPHCFSGAPRTESVRNVLMQIILPFGSRTITVIESTLAVNATYTLTPNHWGKTPAAMTSKDACARLTIILPSIAAAKPSVPSTTKSHFVRSQRPWKFGAEISKISPLSASFPPKLCRNPVNFRSLPSVPDKTRPTVIKTAKEW